MIPRKQTHTRKMTKLRMNSRGMSMKMRRATRKILKRRRLTSLPPLEVRLARGDHERIIKRLLDY